MENISAIIEALILASESPLTLDKICTILDGVDRPEVQNALDQLIVGYDQRQSGISVQEVAGGFQFRTRTEMSVWVKKLKGTKPATLSPAALETLAIVAYRQPIVKAEIETVRGVDVGAPLKGLLEKKLIRIVGRKDVPGKPIIYGTTKKFLEVFNLKELADLPTMRELKEITEQQGILDLETVEETATGSTEEREMEMAEEREVESVEESIEEHTEEITAESVHVQETPEHESFTQDIVEDDINS
ncbi:MAG: SMC-Scp complex subunit ScpB [Deltaproteobacteria bacterium]|nr:SMC-Scp complex subunit ScpB [Deltaproteobacteria bacterium]